jgi:hypothetical protein
MHRQFIREIPIENCSIAEMGRLLDLGFILDLEKAGSVMVYAELEDTDLSHVQAKG